MSYVHMNHAAWVNANNAAGRRIYANHRPKRNIDGRVVGFHASPEKLDLFQAKVMDILGMVFGGIYNAPITWERVDWNYCRSGLLVSFSTRACMSTFDYDQLTKFVFLCHVARIRGAIEAVGPHCYRMTFFQRAHAGDMNARHPDLAEAVTAFQAYLPDDHRVRWSLPPETYIPPPGY